MTHIIFKETDTSIMMDHRWFTPLYWEQRGAIIGETLGRNTTYFVEHDQHQWVLRHYYRGGFAAQLSQDHYLYLGQNKCRSIAEFKLLQTMRAMNLPVPKPIAAHVEQCGLTYRADLIIEKLEGYQDLLAWLLQDAMPMNAWKRIGTTLATFHQAYIDHADLNLKNILWNGEQAYLIDFDQSQRRTKAGRWQQRNLQRLERSFNKAKRKYPELHYSAHDFKILMAAYQSCFD